MIALLLAYMDDENDKEKFEKMYYIYRKQMVSLAYSILNNTEDSEDVVHSVFLKISQKYWDFIKYIDNEVDLRNYLLKSVKNMSFDFLRRKKKERHYFDMEITKKSNEIDIDNCELIDLICRKFEYEQLVESINLLKPIYRDVLYYHLVVELSVSEIAKILGQTISATKKQLVRGKKSLIALLNLKGADTNAYK